MAKQMLNIPSFKGGLNTSLDPRDIKPNEMSIAKNIMFDKNGVTRCIGKSVPYSLLSGQVTGAPILAHGYGLFTFSSNYSGLDSGAALGGDFSESEIYSYEGEDDTSITGDNWYIMSNGRNELNIKSSIEELWDSNHIVPLLEDSADFATSNLKSVYYTSDDACRISNANIITKYESKNKWFGVIKRTNQFINAAATTDYYFNGWYALDNDIKKPTELLFLTGGSTIGGTADNATGFSMKIFATTDGGLDFTEDLNASDELVYDFAATFIYDGIQESLLFEETDKVVKESDGSIVIPTAMNALSIQVGVKTGFNPRITGGRIYYKKANSNDDYVLLCDIEFEKGLRASLDNTHIDGAWTIVASSGTNVSIKSNTVLLTSRNLDTYSSLTEWGTRESRISIGCVGDNYPIDSNIRGAKISEGYKCSTIVNRRAFIANCKLYHNEGASTGIATAPSNIEADRIYYSGMCSRNGVSFESAFDCFPRSNYIDVVKGDAEEYTALIGYADRLLAFKNKTLYIINVAGEPAEWFLESQHNSMGVLRPCQITKTEDGVMWANINGAYVYTGGEVRTTTTEDISFGADIKNLSRDKILQTDWFSVEGEIGVGYISKSQQFYVTDSTRTGNSATGYIYDFKTNTWSRFTKETIFQPLGSLGSISNIVQDYNGNSIWAVAKDFEISSNVNFIVNGEFDQDVDPDSDGYYDGTGINGWSTSNEAGYDDNVITVSYSEQYSCMSVAVHNPVTGIVQGNMFYTVPASFADLQAGEIYNFSIDFFTTNASVGGAVTLLYRKYGTSEWTEVDGTGWISNEWDEWRTISNQVSITSTGRYEIRISLYINATGNDESPIVNLYFKNASIYSVSEVDTNEISFHSFKNLNYINIQEEGEERFNLPTNYIDIRTKDFDFGQPGLKKRIYSVFITHKSSHAQTAPVSYALDGNSSIFANLTGNMSADSSGEWTVSKFYPSSPLTCQSIRFKITNPTNAGVIEINDITVEHRITSRKVA